MKKIRKRINIGVSQQEGVWNKDGFHCILIDKLKRQTYTRYISVVPAFLPKEIHPKKKSASRFYKHRMVKYQSCRGTIVQEEGLTTIMSACQSKNFKFACEK